MQLQDCALQVYGPESSGKTTLALHAMAAVQRAGGTALLVDAEHAFDPQYSKARLTPLLHSLKTIVLQTVQAPVTLSNAACACYGRHWQTYSKSCCYSIIVVNEFIHFA